MVRWVVSFVLLTLALLVAAFGPPLAIGVAAAVTREPLLGLITGLIGMFVVFTLVQKIENGADGIIRAED